ncbi:MAG: DUF1294 domain-containing protein [Clostridiaceae bacterium]|nr:DUF1294 domain-containing protein [Clostridiaceae bacterium]
MRTLLIYLIVVNIAAFTIMGIDKYKAQRNKWRISETSIFAVGIIGGALGIFLGMSFFHHKTKHLKFTLGIPVVVILNIAMFGYILQKLKL